MVIKKRKKSFITVLILLSTLIPVSTQAMWWRKAAITALSGLTYVASKVYGGAKTPEHVGIAVGHDIDAAKQAIGQFTNGVAQAQSTPISSTAEAQHTSLAAELAGAAAEGAVHAANLATSALKTTVKETAKLTITATTSAAILAGIGYIGYHLLDKKLGLTKKVVTKESQKQAKERNEAKEGRINNQEAHAQQQVALEQVLTNQNGQGAQIADIHDMLKRNFKKQILGIPSPAVQQVWGIKRYEDDPDYNEEALLEDPLEDQLDETPITF